ncbi:MAG: hypothetical protein CMP69_00915 [Flavobacteriales bacterium]|nr:hypothetical protein [Flavobacteriales bacterium]|tara:strand:- start:795 stop:1535 length:741 start_codon:yes stop_codon:yes gene_type:complete
MYNFYNINFIDGNYVQAINMLKNKAFMVAPSGPGLSKIDKNHQYRKALQAADFAIPDSSLMIILYLLFYQKKIQKMSGPKFLRGFLKEQFLRNDYVLFSIDPSDDEKASNNELLVKQGIKIKITNHYVAPNFNSDLVEDENLLNILENIDKKPSYILINIAGGVQECLGHYIKKKLSYDVGIICTGAAIAFETGKQARVPIWADSLYLGWLARVVQNPKLYVKRYIQALRLFFVFYLCRVKKNIES